MTTQFSLTTLLIIFLILIFLDKSITIMNVKIVGEEVEKNPLQKWFFRNLGLYGGAVVYGLISLATCFIAFSLINKFYGGMWALWTIMMVYGMVIFNNLFWYLVNSKII